jgi:serine/threonine protein kinase
LIPEVDPLTLQAGSEDECLHWVLALRSCTFTHAHMTMDDFTIISVIGRGFYGKVMLCENIQTKDRVAIKTVHKSRLVEANKVHTIMMERNILSRLNHPFIVSLKFAFQSPSKFYLGLEYAEGGELFYTIQKNGLPTLADLRLYMAELALALDYLHQNGIIYRDIKPENILLDAGGHIKLTDFGLAKDLRHGCRTGTFCGTSDYIAPEIVKREPYGFPVDWWASGILLYELNCGQTPFNHVNRARLFKNIVESPVAFPLDIDPGVREYIELTLEKDPEKRAKFDELKNCSFFEGLNWDEVLAKRLRPSYHADALEDSHLQNFDEEFTQEQAMDSAISPVCGLAVKLPGFSFPKAGIIPLDEEDGTVPPSPICLGLSPTSFSQFSPF